MEYMNEGLVVYRLEMKELLMKSIEAQFKFKELDEVGFQILIEKILTNDGTATLYSKEFDESYHSQKDGALRESLEKHIIPAFKFSKDRDEITILDICFGLGYNTLSTILYVNQNNIKSKIKIISPEFDRELIASLSDLSIQMSLKISEILLNL